MLMVIATKACLLAMDSHAIVYETIVGQVVDQVQTESGTHLCKTDRNSFREKNSS